MGSTKIAVAGALLAAFWVGGATAQEHTYVGVKSCSVCHKKDKIGNQYGMWQKSPHAKAYEALKSDKAAMIAKEKGLSKPAYEAGECLKCHATAYGLEPSQLHGKPLEVSDGVQCESCHGPGSDYRKTKTMKDRAAAVAAGMWEPGKDEKICQKCHNSESPTSKTFDYEKYKKMIAHPIPEQMEGS